MTVQLELGQVRDDYARRALEQLSMGAPGPGQLLPPGGSAGQVPVKNADGSITWQTIKCPITRAYDYGALRTLNVGSLSEPTTNMRMTVNFTMGNYVRFLLTGQCEHNNATTAAVRNMQIQIFDLTAGTLIPSAGSLFIKRLFLTSQNESFVHSVVLPVGSSGAVGYVQPGPRTLTVQAMTDVGTCYWRNDTNPMVFTAEELQQ